MKTCHPPKTGLEGRFEDELASAVPHWESDVPRTQAKKAKHSPKSAKEDKTVEESMILSR